MSGHSGIKGDLLANSGNANALEKLYAGNAAGINSVLTPTLTAEAVNPQGYSPTQLAAQTTAAQQSAGGSNAGAVGGSLLRAARTRNIGAAPAAIGEANRNASQRLGNINAGIQAKSADIAQANRQAGLKGLEGLYGENVSGGNQALGLSNQALAGAGNLKNFWQDLLSNSINAGSNIASAFVGRNNG